MTHNPFPLLLVFSGTTLIGISSLLSATNIKDLLIVCTITTLFATLTILQASKVIEYKNNCCRKP